MFERRRGLGRLVARMDDTTKAILSIWQPVSSRPLGVGDAKEIVSNLTGLFNVLREWDEQDALLAPLSKEAL